MLHAYEHFDKWANRIILGDSRVMMNSVLRYNFGTIDCIRYIKQ